MALVTMKGLKAVADLDLQIRGGPSRKKKMFRPFGPQFGPQIRGGAGPPGPSPGSTTEKGWASKGFPLATRIMFNYLPKKALPA